MHLPNDENKLVSNTFVQQSFECRFFSFQVSIIFTIPNRRFGKVSRHNVHIILYTLFLFVLVQFYVSLHWLSTTHTPVIKPKQNTVHSVLTAASLDSAVHNCGSIRLRECLVEYEQSNRKDVRLECAHPRFGNWNLSKLQLRMRIIYAKNISFFYYVAVRNTTTRGIDRIRACLSRNAQSS